MFDPKSFRETYDSEAAFLAAWNQRRFKRITTKLPPEDSVMNVAHFIAGHSMHEGFRLFKNGGTPQLEKRRANRVFEIIFRPGQPGVAGLAAPYTITAHVSDTRLKLQRELYWKVPSMAPAIIASTQLDQLEIPPHWAIYDAETDIEGVEWVSDRILASLVPWFSLFIRPSGMLDRLRLQQIPRIERDTALELVILERGEDAGVEFLLELLNEDRDLDAVLRNEVQRLARAQKPNTALSGELERLARIAARLGLLSRF